MTATVAALVGLIAVVGPLAAVHERWQRQDIERLQSERENLIAEITAESERLARERNEFEKRLKQIDPRLKEYEPQQEKMLEMARDRYRPYVMALPDDPANRQERAYAHLGLAIIEKELREWSAAEIHLDKVRGLLEDILKGDPTANHIRAAQADCFLLLSQVQNGNGQPHDALESAARARECRAQFDRDHPTVASRKALVDSYIALARLQFEVGDADVALDSLSQAKQMVDNLGNRWPDNPVQLYLVACTLADCHPSLVAASLSRDEPPAERD